MRCDLPDGSRHYKKTGNLRSSRRRDRGSWCINVRHIRCGIVQAQVRKGWHREAGETRGDIGAGAVSRILEFLEKIREITTVPSLEDHEVLTEVPGIDAGGDCPLQFNERGLRDFRVMTGDKRSIKALANEAKCERVAARVQGRVICLEQIIRLLILRFGFTRIQAKVIREPKCDVALKLIFGVRESALEANAMEGLASYINDLRRQRIDLLAPDGVYRPPALTSGRSPAAVPQGKRHNNGSRRPRRSTRTQVARPTRSVPGGAYRRPSGAAIL